MIYYWSKILVNLDIKKNILIMYIFSILLFVLSKIKLLFFYKKNNFYDE